MNTELITNFNQAVQDIEKADKHKNSQSYHEKVQQAIEAFERIRSARKTSSITKEESSQIHAGAKKLFGSMSKDEARTYKLPMNH